MWQNRCNGYLLLLAFLCAARLFVFVFALVDGFLNCWFRHDTLKPLSRVCICLLPICALVEVLPHVRFITALPIKTSAAVFSAGHYTLCSCRYVRTVTRMVYEFVSSLTFTTVYSSYPLSIFDPYQHRTRRIF